jgi:CRP/FNR family cyclic AMP-dependent transcriptional regulator
MLTIVEKVLFLQRIDILAAVPSHGLAHVAMIATEETYPKETVLFEEGDPAEALYFIVEGKVRLTHGGREVQTAQKYDAFGTWALFDDEALVVSARTTSEVFALKIERQEFLDLLPDHGEIANGVLKALSQRIRSLLHVQEPAAE